MGPQAIARARKREWMGGGRRMSIEALFVLAETIHELGALRLGALMVDDIGFAKPDITSLERGRLLILRSRLDWKMGEQENAADRYRFVQSLARKTRSAELDARRSQRATP